MPGKITKGGVASQITRRSLSIVSSATDGTTESLSAGYAGYEPDLVPICHELYYLKPAVRTVNQRRYPRIPCRNVKACIRTEQGSSAVVNLVNMSRGGLCFTSEMEFCPGTRVSIATHFIEGGHNIFQDGRIIRVQSKGSATLPGEYAVEFVDNSV
jgi:hypothetical protein